MQSIIDFVLAHKVAMASVGVAVLDFVFALMPSWQSNGVIHWVYLTLKGLLPGSSS